ncbi:MAG: hypothetical protein QXJ59_01825 [Thermofilaceae archaeon]
MAFDHLKPKPATRITTAWGHALIDVLNLFYDWLTTGERDVRVASVDAAYGYFSEQVLVKGRPVIKDGDPITIYDIYDAARIRITEAIDAARSTLYLSLLYGKFNGMFMDAYGRVGVAIYDDRIGLAKSSDVAAVRDRLPSSLTSAGNLRTAIMEDAVGLARDSTLAAVRDRLPSSLTTAGNFRIAVVEDGVGLAKESTLSSILGRLDVALSTRASESTLGGIKSQTDRLTFDASNRLYVNAAVVANPPNLDVALSTRASESTLAAVRDRLPSSLTTAGNFKAAVVEDAVGLARESTLSSILNRLDVALSSRLSESTFTARVPVLSTQTLDIGGSAYAALNVVPSIGGDISRMPYTIDNIPVTTTESSVAIAPPGAKLIRITNKGDVDCLVGVNGPVPASNPLRVRAGCSVTFPFRGATSIYYRTERGSTVISITYFN